MKNTLVSMNEKLKLKENDDSKKKIVSLDCLTGPNYSIDSKLLKVYRTSNMASTVRIKVVPHI